MLNYGLCDVVPIRGLFHNRFPQEVDPPCKLRTTTARRVLGENRYEVTDPVIASEAGEQGDADVHHAFGLRDHNRTPPEPRQPMPLARIVPLDAMGIVLARIELPDR